MEERTVDNMLIFLEAAGRDLQPGQSKEFTCPICEGKAVARRAAVNGHIWARCESCGENIME